MQQTKTLAWYTLGLKRPMYLTVWISICIVLTICILDLMREMVDGFDNSDIITGWMPMKMATAFCLIISVTILLFRRIGEPGFFRKFLSVGLTVIISIVSLLSLYSELYYIKSGQQSYLTHIMGLELFLAPDERMACFIALNLVLLSCIFWSLHRNKSNLAHLLNIPVALISYFFMLCFVLNITVSYPSLVPLSLNASIAMLALCSAIFFIYPETRLLKVFTSGHTGGIIARQMLLPCLLIPVIIGWLRITGERKGIFTSEIGVIYVALTYVLFFLLLGWITATTLNKIDRQRISHHDDLMKANRILNALGKSSQAMMYSQNEFQFLQQVCEIITEDCGYLMVWIGYARDDSKKTVEPVAYYGLDMGYIEKMNVSWGNNDRGRGPTGTAIRTGKPAMCRNMLTDPAFGPWREEAIKRGYASSIVLPLISDGKAFGAISIYSREPDPFTDEDLKLLSDLANDLAYGITNIRLNESERKAAKTIRESEEKYRMLFNQMVEGFALHEIILDEKGIPHDYRFISVNPAFEDQTGLKADHVVGKTAREIMPELEKCWIDNYGRVALTGKSMDFENYSAPLNAYFRVSAFSPKKGFFAVIFENITKRIVAEKELKKTKNYLENLINYANAPIIVWNRDAEIQLFNRAFEHLTGYTSAEVEGKKLEILFPEDTLAESNEKITIALTKNWETIEIPILTKSKTIRTVLWNSANIHDSDNGTILSTIAQGNDITERIAAEQEVRKVIDKLDLALNNANIGIWTWEIDDDIFEGDERIGKMLGLEKLPFRYTYDDFEKCLYEEDIPHFHKGIRYALQNNSPFDTIFRIKTTAGGFRHINIKGRVDKDPGGKTIKMTGVCMDITATKVSTDQTLLRLNEDLLRSNKELEQFAYVASHDLQEPLRMVSSFTQLLAMRYKDKLDSEAHDFINYAVDGAQRMQGLINDLLHYSRIKTRGRELVVINMNDVITQTLHNLSIKIKEKNAKVTFDPLPEVLADSGQMIQLFQNLIENSIKFSHKPPQIHISAYENKDNFQFMVKDNGIGIEPQYFERIFQIFQRLHLREEFGGTGIGLAICKRIVERHNGKIWVESKPGEGTIFNFTILKG